MVARFGGGSAGSDTHPISLDHSRKDATVTREQKLALIIGFSIVLLVGVLVSDHLSRARFESLDPVGATQADEAGGLVALKPADPARQTPRNTGRQVASRDAAPFDRTIGASDLGPSMGPSMQRPIASANPSEPTGVPGQAGFYPIQDDTPAEDEAPAFRLTQDPSVRNSVPALNADEIGDRLRNWRSQAPAAARTTTYDRAPRDTARKAAVHHVQPGESLFGIAQQYLGDGNRWREIAALNEGRVGSNGSVKLGVALRIPGVGVQSPASRPASRVSQPAATPSVYEVRPGDTLGEIAMRTLGTSKRTDDLLAANRDLIDDADEIRVGMRLKIPAG